MPAVVIINRHEPEGEVATRLLELAEEKGYDARTIEAQRGEHDASLSFRAPQDVVDAFEADRAKRWPDRTTDDEADRPAALNEDAYAAEAARTANEARVENAAAAEDQSTSPGRKDRPGKPQTK